MPVDNLKELLQNPETTPEQLLEAVNEIDHFEIARLLHQLTDEEKVQIFQLLKDDIKKQEVLYETDTESRSALIAELGHENMAQFLEAMPKDEAVDILQEAGLEVQEKILEQMVPDEAQTLKNLLSYKEETAGGLMSPHFNQVQPHELAGDILMNFLRHNKQEYGTNFYVVNGFRELVGTFTLRDLLNAPPKALATDIVWEHTPHVHLDDSCELVANEMDHEHISTIPVVDDQNVLHGIISFDDVLRGLKNMASEDIYTMVGASTKIDAFAQTTRSKLAARAPWLLTTFVGGMVSAYILKLFEFTLSEFSMVLFFIPFVLGLAGNVGLQGATVIVRGLATGDIQDDNLKSVIRSEVKVGVCHGLIFGMVCGFIIMTIAKTILASNPMLGLAVGLGIVLAVSMAAFIGSLTPWMFKKLDIDPAISTGPVVTTVNDIAGLFIYLMTTTLLFTLL
ncbi:magnesium transporter [Nitrospina gracilis]|uniref:magnesium transporter n=1 Tax=Nitrospina gracilis TaxID=35801 RepID=UPI001F00E594|nr:magnesium transporter [Nitrospina gracilis]MCF8720574.1 magnesium transporter [Nitrospina gracilis Nb-211]